MRSGAPQSFDRAAASAYLTRQSEHSTTAMSRILLTSIEQSNDLVITKTQQPFERQKLEIEALSHPIKITVSVGSGPGKGVAWGCDLSYDYVKINAEYTT